MSEPAARPRIVLLPDAGPDVGLGHVSRCLALGRAAAVLGARVSLLVGEDVRAVALVRAAGLETLAAADGAAALDRLGRMEADVVVVDSYRASPEFFGSLRAVATQVVAVDDLADRPLAVDLVVNGGAAAEGLPYRRAPGMRFLLGPRYALLDPRYAEPPGARGGDRVSRVLVTVGGGRHEACLLTALSAVDDALDAVGDVSVDVVVGPGGDGPRVAAAARASRHRVTVHADVAGLRALIAAADLAISGAGMTLYELCATATPAAMVCMADNQRPNFAAFERADAALAAGAAGDAGLGAGLRAALARLLADHALRAALAARGRALVDGQGAARVARAIVAPVGAFR